MTTMLEKAARAAEEAGLVMSGAEPSEWYRHVARAVLMAVREPGAGTVQSGMNATGFNWGVSHSSWQAMIDHILSEGGDQ